jgi:hypothetical protein
MNRRQRGNHARLWPFLILVLVGVSAAALVAKSAVDRAVLHADAIQIK